MIVMVLEELDGNVLNDLFSTAFFTILLLSVFRYFINTHMYISLNKKKWFLILGVNFCITNFFHSWNLKFVFNFTRNFSLAKYLLFFFCLYFILDHYILKTKNKCTRCNCNICMCSNRVSKSNKKFRIYINNGNEQT